MKNPWNFSEKYTRIKLCEFESLDCAYEASFLGADFLGFHIFVEQDHIAKALKFKEIFKYLPQYIDKTLLTDLKFVDMFKVLSIIDVDTIQLYNDVSRDDVIAIKNKYPDIKILKVMSEKSEENFTKDDDEFIQYYYDIVDAFLLDSFREGGTGITGNWSHCAEIVKKTKIPVFLAGGLTADNVEEAINEVRPFGVDVENGVSNKLFDGIRVKNMAKCRLFIEKVQEADWKLNKLC